MAKKEYLSPRLETCAVFEDAMIPCTHTLTGEDCRLYNIKVSQGICPHAPEVLNITCRSKLS